MITKKLSILFAVFMFYSISSFGQSKKHTVSQATLDDYEAHIFESSNNEPVAYRLFVPVDYDSKKKYPLVLFHHGGGGTGNDNIHQFEGPCPREWAGTDRQKDNPCFILAPQIPASGSGNRENPSARTAIMQKHIKTIHEIIDHLESKYSIDKEREYVTGLSMGGGCTWMSIIERPERFAAAVPICASDKTIGMSASERGKKFAQMPLWIIHGADDKKISVDVSREVVKELKRAGGNPRYTEYPNTGHNSWVKAYREPKLIEWLFNQKREIN